MIVPNTIKVGFTNRTDTYTGKLGYVVYFDDCGVLRKETSWNSWRDASIEPLELANDPVEGFVINKGDTGRCYSHYDRNPFIRVYDPRGFEFEITLGNLIMILQYCSCDKGKGISGELAYGWDGTSLYLVPVDSPEYKEGKTFFNLQKTKVNTKNIVPGMILMKKALGDKSRYTYLGKFAIDSIRLPRAYYLSDLPEITEKSKTKASHLFYVESKYGPRFENINPSLFNKVVETREVDSLIEEFQKNQFDYNDLRFEGVDNFYSIQSHYLVDDKTIISGAYVLGQLTQVKFSITENGIRCEKSNLDTSTLQKYPRILFFHRFYIKI